MADPEAERRYVDEAQEALGSLVVAGCDGTCVLQLFEAALDEVSQPVEHAVDRDTEPAELAHCDDWHDVARLHGFANLARVIAAIV